MIRTFEYIVIVICIFFIGELANQYVVALMEGVVPPNRLTGLAILLMGIFVLEKLNILQPIRTRFRHSFWLYILPVLLVIVFLLLYYQVDFDAFSNVKINPENNFSVISKAIIFFTTAAIAEELFYRVLIFNFFARKKSYIAALLISSLVFAASHIIFSMPLLSIIYYFLGGLFFGLARMISIGYACYCHVIKNLIIVFFSSENLPVTMIIAEEPNISDELSLFYQMILVLVLILTVLVNMSKIYGWKELLKIVFNKA